MGQLRPPIKPMLARLARELPRGDGRCYEPKWDGFRCLAFRSGDDVDLRSRNDRPLSRYFPEVVDALRGIAHAEVVLDGELLVVNQGGFDFGALMSRLHPATSRVELLARTTPATLVVFDLLAVDDMVLLDRPYEQRRKLLEHTISGAPSALVVTPMTRDPDVAQQWLERYSGSGIDGVVVKDEDVRYEPGRRAMTKVKLDRTADCVLAGFRWDGARPVVSSLLLGLYGTGLDGEEVLRHVGVVSSFTSQTREHLVHELAPLAVPLERHPWRHGFALEGGPTGRLKGAAGRWTPDLELDWVPLAPELVCEVGYDQVDACRFRHPARWRRWRPDRSARSCRIEQLEEPPPAIGTGPTG